MSEIAIYQSALTGHKNNVLSIAFHPTLPLLVTGSKDKTAKLWRLSPDGLDATCTATLKGHKNNVSSVAFYPNALILATGSEDKTVKLWHFSSEGSDATCVATLEEHKNNVFSVAFHPILPILATGSEDKTVKLWHFSSDGSDATCTTTLNEKYGVLCVVFHPILPILATDSADNTAKLWRLSPDGLDVTCIATLAGHSHSVLSVAFHPIMKNMIATGSADNTAKLWWISEDDESEVTCLETLVGHSNFVFSVAFHPIFPILATGSTDYTAKLWWIAPRIELEVTCFQTLDRVNSVVFHPKLPILANGSDDKTVELWKLDLNSLFHLDLAFSNNQQNNDIHILNNLYNPRNSANNSCPDYTELYKFIMKQNLTRNFKFIIQGQPVQDIGGVKRDIFQKILPVYTNKFFEIISSNNDFIVLKEKIDFVKFLEETEQLILLTQKAKTLIFLRIDPRLLDLLLSPDLKKYFSNNKKFFSKFYKNVNNAIQNNTYDILNSNSNSIFLRINKNQNNKNRVINEYKKKIDPFSNKWEEEPPQIMSMNNFNKLGQEKDQEQKQDIKNVLIREIRLRRFLAECGFSSWEQVQNMYLFIKKFWKPENFSSELKFDIESFSKKIKIFKENNYNDIIEISLDKFIKLSINNSMQFNFNNLNSNISKIYSEYTFFRPFLNYILGPESTDESRKLFVNYVAGTIYYPGELYLILSHQFAPYPFKSETCFQKLKFFKNNPENSQLKINNATKFIEKEIKPNRGSVNFGFA
jgi:WD40 repeat protein